MLLIIGNVLIGSIHHLHDDIHSEEDNSNECQICEIIKTTSNFVSDIQEITFLNNNTDHLCIYECFSIIELNFKSKYLSRAPPIS